MLEPSSPLFSSIEVNPALPATPPTTSTVAVPPSILRADQIFFDGLVAMAIVPFVLIVFCSVHQAWRSHLHHRQIHLLEKLWLLTPSQSHPFK